MHTDNKPAAARCISNAENEMTEALQAKFVAFVRLFDRCERLLTTDSTTPFVNGTFGATVSSLVACCAGLSRDQYLDVLEAQFRKLSEDIELLSCSKDRWTAAPDLLARSSPSALSMYGRKLQAWRQLQHTLQISDPRIDLNLHDSRSEQGKAVRSCL